MDVLEERLGAPGHADAVGGALGGGALGEVKFAEIAGSRSGEIGVEVQAAQPGLGARPLEPRADAARVEERLKARRAVLDDSDRTAGFDGGHRVPARHGREPLDRSRLGVRPRDGGHKLEAEPGPRRLDGGRRSSDAVISGVIAVG